ncbi:MAG: hypothetical protein ACQCN5_05175 [Candidatus Bathyarchaeia archaeon]|jgi:hypothetical protein
MKKKPVTLHSQKAAIKCIALIMLVLSVTLIGAVSASRFNYNSIQKTCPDPKVHFVAGSDSQLHPNNYPAATVHIAPSYTSACVKFSLFPSESNTLQPATYYTDLLRLKNYGAACSVKSITISDINGASNLGNLTIYFYAAQTDTPQTGNPIAAASLNNSSTGTINLLSTPYTLATFAVNYLEVVGYAASTAPSDSTVSFTLTIQTEAYQPAVEDVKGVGSLLMKHSTGAYSGSFGSRAYFAFNIKSVDGDLKGEFNLIFRHTDAKGHSHVYQIRSITPTSLNVSKCPYQASTANFTLTGIIREITNPFHPVIIARNVEVQVTLTDYSNKPDTIAFTITSPSGQLYFSSNWRCGVSFEQSLRSGTLSIG